MKDEIDIDERHKIDDLFRKVLGDYTEPPSDNLWNHINRRLNLKIWGDFVTFKKTPKTESSEKFIIPLYRQQWFRVAVAACIALLIVFISVIIVNRTSDQFTGKGREIAKNSNLISPKGNVNNNYFSYNSIDWNLTISNKSIKGYKFYDNLVFDIKGNSIKEIPYLFNYPDKLIPEENNVNYANNPEQVNPDKNQNKKTTNGGVEKNFQPNLANSGNENNNIPNNTNVWNNDQGPVIADNSNNNNNPLGIVNQRNLPDTLSDTSKNSIIKNEDSLKKTIPVEDNLQVNDSNPEKNIIQDDNENRPVIDTLANFDDNTDPEVTVPNVFTPNSDGLNDYLYIANLEYYPDNNLIIQDRKGKIVYRKKEYQSDWNAANVEDGIYFYILTYKNSKNETITRKGVVYIMRSF